MRAVWIVPILASIFILFLAQSYAESGNTTVVGPFPFFGTAIIFTVTDPDGISTVGYMNGDMALFDIQCLSPASVVVPSQLLPITVTVTDCQANPDVTVWLIDSTGTTCIEGSCLPPDDDDDDDDDEEEDDDDEEEDDDDEEDEDD